MPFLYTVLVIASVFFYILYEHAFSFYLFAFLLAVPIVLFIVTLHTSRKIRINFVDKQTTTGRSAKLPIKLKVENLSSIPCPNLIIEIEYQNMLEGKSSVMKINTPLYPNETQIMTLTVSGIHCGTVVFRIKRCRISDMLKLFTMKIKTNEEDIFGSKCTFTILPDYIPIENNIANYEDMGLETDEYSKTQKGDDPSEIFDIRDYVDGDKLNRIHWKLTAKQDKTMVKDYSMPISNSIMLMLELVHTPGKGDELIQFDTLIETVSSISGYLLENSVPHRLAFYDKAADRLNVLNITDEESHHLMIGMLLRSRLYDEHEAAAEQYICNNETFRCGHLIYVSTDYSPRATELMSDADLAYKYTYLLMAEEGSSLHGISDEYAEIFPIYPGKLSESIQELCL